MKGIQLAACWLYSADPSSNLAQIKFYGIDNTGETLLGTISLSYAAANEYTADSFVYYPTGDYFYVRYELDTSSADNFIKLHHAELIGYVETMPEDGTAIS